MNKKIYQISSIFNLSNGTGDPIAIPNQLTVEVENSKELKQQGLAFYDSEESKAMAILEIQGDRWYILNTSLSSALIGFGSLNNDAAPSE